jgi:hypothetical protein
MNARISISHIGGAGFSARGDEFDPEPLHRIKDRYIMNANDTEGGIHAELPEDTGDHLSSGILMDCFERRVHVNYCPLKHR